MRRLRVPDGRVGRATHANRLPQCGRYRLGGSGVGSGSQLYAIRRMHHCECGVVINAEQRGQRKSCRARCAICGIPAFRLSNGGSSPVAQSPGGAARCATEHEMPSTQSATAPDVLGPPEVGVESSAEMPEIFVFHLSTQKKLPPFIPPRAWGYTAVQALPVPERRGAMNARRIRRTIWGGIGE